MADAPDNLPQSIDALNRLRITSCPACGILFAMPQQIWSQRVNDGGKIWCPNGCVAELRDTPETRENLAILNVELLAEITQTRCELDATRQEIARLPHPPESPVSGEELQRRIELTVSRASRIKHLDPICIYCGRSYTNPSSFRAHLKREHAETISNQPAICFD